MELSKILVIIFVVICILLLSSSNIENYRDPIYLNSKKLNCDWYPRANGSIYGFPHKLGGTWDIFSGYPYYDKAY